MIYLTGDIHSDANDLINRVKSIGEENYKKLTKNDYVIVLGDFGLIWNYQKPSKKEEYWYDYFTNVAPYTVLFIDGNHENFDRLNAYPVEEWNGGKVHKITDSIIHLIRGQVFNLEGLTFLAMGGADSHDIRDGILEMSDPRIKEWQKDPFKLFRVNHLYWWEQERITSKDYEEAIKNLKNVSFKVDYVLSHAAPKSVTYFLVKEVSQDKCSEILQDFYSSIYFKWWYCGHYHLDKRSYENKLSCLYYGIERIA